MASLDIDLAEPGLVRGVLTRSPRGRRVALDRRAVAGSLGRVEAAVVALAGLAVFALYAWVGRYWIDLVDEGYFLYLASRVADGDLPYRDFDTYYTPGIFYLYAAAFKLFGVSVGPIRLLMAATRAIWAVVLYRLTRRVAPWPFALLPFLVVAAVDGTPISPEPHPSWFATLATLVTLELLARHRHDPRVRWAALAGLAAGIAFGFKQNVGAFAALAIGGYLLLHERRMAGRLMLIGQGLFAVMLGLAATALLWPGLDARVASMLWLPLLAMLGLLVRSAWMHAGLHGWSSGLAPFLRDASAAGAAFAAVTVLWLVPLTLALGAAATPFGLFVGAVNQGALIMPLPPPPPASWTVALAALWLPIGVASIPWGGARRPGRRVVFAALAATMVILLLPVPERPVEPPDEQASLYPWLGYLGRELGALYVYLPGLGAWTGLATFGVAVRRGAPVEPLAAYLLVGMLAHLALFPRLDTAHAMFAGPPLFVVGAWGLARVHHALAGRAVPLVRALMFAALLMVPVAAAAPHVYWRYVTLVYADPRAPAPPPYVPLDLKRAPVLAPQNVADNIRGAVRFVQEGTPPGQPFFAFPVVPMFNFLADQPNPTRFNHFIPGALTDDDYQQVIRDLDARKPRFVLWDHGGVVYWGVNLAEGGLSDYIWGCYEQVANFPPYLILERRCP